MLDRRELLRSLCVGAGLLVARRWPQSVPMTGDDAVFAHGVASGDPTAEAVMLWTRAWVQGIGDQDEVTVRWTVASDPELRHVVAGGDTLARAEHDWTVQVDVSGLAPASTWWYCFDALGQRSAVGRTRTAPGPGDDRELRLGVISCSSYASGHFNAYLHLARRDLDLIVHLGDAIYENRGASSIRPHLPPTDALTLADYRLRHAQYRRDPDFQALCQGFPLATVWDDHEVAGNVWGNATQGGASNHNPATQGPWSERRDAGLRAYLEWFPLRRPVPSAPERIWRSLPLGANGELLLLDTRHDDRHRQVGTDHPDPARALADPGRGIMSRDQEEWLAQRLRTSKGTWRVLANQVLLAPLPFQIPPSVAPRSSPFGLVIDGAVINPDQWDGYPAARQRLLEVIEGDDVGPVVVLTGDLHSSWACEVPAQAQPGAPPVAVELVTPSVTSSTFAQAVGVDSDLAARALTALVADQLPHVRWAELASHGYVVVGVSSQRVQADWWHVDSVVDAAAGEHHDASWTTMAGDPRLRPAVAPLEDRPLPAPLPGPPLRPDPTTAAVPPGGADTFPPRLGVLGAAALAGAGGLLALRARRRR